MQVQEQNEYNARIANAIDKWDKLWENESKHPWRKDALKSIYDRIEQLIPKKSSVVDIGGGIGILAKQLRDNKECSVYLMDHSKYAVAEANANGITATVNNFEEYGYVVHSEAMVVCTETLEHLSEKARDYLLKSTNKGFFSVPNDRLGPDEEPQHTIKFNALEFKKYLSKYFKDVRVEVLGYFLLGICGFPKHFTLSVCTPARDEAEDLDSTLSSFMGVADEIIVGIDPRTEDNTREIVSKYTDKIFDLEEPQGPPDDRMPDGGIHFAWIRNQCMNKCTSNWVFMTEAHEKLSEGQDVLLALDKIMPSGAKVGYVYRTGNGQRWAFPWLCKNEKQFRYKRATHNILDIPEGTGVVRLPQICTLHERVKDRSKARAEQRKIQNRQNLLEDWTINNNENSLFYLGQEWRENDHARGIKYLTKFIAVSNNGAAKYQARLMLAKLYAKANNKKEAYNILIHAVDDDWSRTEHWLWLGDLAFGDEQFEKALQFYTYASTKIDNPPFTLWWIDLAMYGYLIAQRLAMCYSELNDRKNSLKWAEKVLELFPDNIPEEAIEEAKRNIEILKESVPNEDLS